MIQAGQYQTLKIDRLTSVGFYLLDEESGVAILLPQKYIHPNMEIGDEIEVFVYADSQDRLVATMEHPLLTAGQFGWLQVEAVNEMGAFCDWGLMEKQLLVPFRNQAAPLKVGKSYIVYLYEDSLNQRLVGSTRVDSFLKSPAAGNLSEGEQVELLVRGFNDLGAMVIINHAFRGLLYESELFQNVRPGDQLTGYVKYIRPDNKVDVSLQPIGYASVEPNAARLLDALERADGFLPFHDKSDPDDIRQHFGISKKLFKKAVGSLYKQKRIVIEEKGIRLL